MDASGWIGAALAHFRVLLMDQRGTGLSSALTARSILARSSDPAVQAEYCSHFRADNIIRDCEVVRQMVCGGTLLSVLGQSFGGFCATTYLSSYPEGLKEVLITGKAGSWGTTWGGPVQRLSPLLQAAFLPWCRCPRPPTRPTSC